MHILEPCTAFELVLFFYSSAIIRTHIKISPLFVSTKTSLLGYALPNSSYLFKTCLWFGPEHITLGALPETEHCQVIGGKKSLCGTVPLWRGLNRIPQAFGGMLDFLHFFFCAELYRIQHDRLQTLDMKHNWEAFQLLYMLNV